jgi:hypothetical protein
MLRDRSCARTRRSTDCSKRELQVAELKKESQVSLRNLSRSDKLIESVWISLDLVSYNCNGKRGGDCCRYGKIVP